MFGISLIEFIVILCVAIIIIGPKDIPDLARSIAKWIYKIKHFIEESKKELKAVGDEIGLEEIKNEVQREMILEKKKLENEITTIVDLEGNEHHIYDIGELRSDLTKEDLETEIAKHNQVNSKND